MAALLDTLILPAGAGLAFTDAATGQPVRAGLRCTLRRRRDGATLGFAQASPGGVHHWPELDARWRSPDPLQPPQADVLVQDEMDRFLPLSLAWPLPAAVTTVLESGARLARLSLLSAPQRPAPPGCASVYAQLRWQSDAAPAAWARLTLSTALGQVTQGCCDAQGVLALHLPMARPQRDAVTGALFANFALACFADRALAAAALRLAAPDALAWAAQAQVRALARADDEAIALESLRIEVGPAAVPITQALVPRVSELRLVAL